MPMSKETFTEKQEKFCQAYSVLVATSRSPAPEAAQEAGYSDWGNEGYRLMRKPHIRDRVQQIQRERSERVGIGYDFVVEKLLDTLMVAEGSAKPKLNSKTGKAIEDSEGNPIYTRDNTTILKCLDMLAKLTNSYPSDKLEVAVSEDDVIKRMLRGRGGQTSSD